ncbi:MAG: DUF2400 family protein, partial [Deltaproteobacteria bacterium]|nr:DUF2400 family protein [Deltaproteobacteria bacterium]
MPAVEIGESLCALYQQLNHREFVHPDPLEFLYSYHDLHDREIVGLVAACLAYGNVRQILKSVSSVLEKMSEPSRFLKKASMASLSVTFSDFKHRFTTGKELATMLYGVKKTVERYGSLQECFLLGLRPDHETVVPA